MSQAQFGTFDDLLRITEESVRHIAEALREVVFGVGPNACEAVRFGRISDRFLFESRTADSSVNEIPSTDDGTVGSYYRCSRSASAG